jgi:glutaryl-CoA dehydrogenase
MIMFRALSCRRLGGLASRSSCRSLAHTKRFASTFDWQDPLANTTLFTEEEVAIWETSKAYCQEQMLPRVLGA